MILNLSLNQRCLAATRLSAGLWSCVCWRKYKTVTLTPSFFQLYIFFFTSKPVIVQLVEEKNKTPEVPANLSLVDTELTAYYSDKN